MIRKLKRAAEFQLTLEISDDAFVRPPRDAQRHSLLNRAVREMADDVVALHRTAAGLARGRDEVAVVDRSQAVLADHEIMEDWQIPIMAAMSEIVGCSRGDVLEIGFGRGVSATMVQAAGVRSHTVVECNDDVVRRYHDWRASYGERDIRLVHARWQEVVEDLGTYDGVLFHTYPLDEAEYLEYVAGSVTFAEHFFPAAARLLRAGGVFTYLTNEVDSLSRGHQRRLLAHFDSITMRVVRDLAIPDDVADTWWADSMVVVAAVRAAT